MKKTYTYNPKNLKKSIEDASKWEPSKEPQDCSICKEWNLPYNTWKSLILFPFHCPGCNFIGYPDDFYLYGTNFMCLECKNKVISRIKKHIGRY